MSPGGNVDGKNQFQCECWIADSKRLGRHKTHMWMSVCVSEHSLKPVIDRWILMSFCFIELRSFISFTSNQTTHSFFRRCAVAIFIAHEKWLTNRNRTTTTTAAASPAHQYRLVLSPHSFAQRYLRVVRQTKQIYRLVRVGLFFVHTMAWSHRTRPRSNNYKTSNLWLDVFQIETSG